MHIRGLSLLIRLGLVGAIPFNLCCSVHGNGMGDLPVFDLEDFEVVTSGTNFAPEFSSVAPAFSLYETQALPKGDLILAINFVDRYRQSAIPGPVKWVGILHFPVLDGYERAHLKWLCIYAYGGQLFGYDPSPLRESLRRFVVPITYEDRNNPRVQVQFAQSYVDEVYGADYEDWIANELDDFSDTDEGAGANDFVNSIPAGRIAPVYSSQAGLGTQELVRLVYQYVEDPNPNPAPVGEIIQTDRMAHPAAPFWSIFEDLTDSRDHLATASQLLAPRWSQRVILHHTRHPFFFVKNEYAEEVLIFNISTRIFAYHPIHGVWRTDATTDDLADIPTLLTKIRIPGIGKINHAEFVSNSKTSD